MKMSVDRYIALAAFAPISEYDKMMAKRCGKPWGNHLTAFALKQNPRACPFVK